MRSALMIKMGDVVLCQESKDIMKVTNGTEHEGVFTPTECCCLRVAHYARTKRGLYPVIGFSYRAFPTGKVSVLQDSLLFKDIWELEKKYGPVRF